MILPHLQVIQKLTLNPDCDAPSPLCLQRQQHLVSLSSGWLSVSRRALPEEKQDSLALWAVPPASADTPQSALVGWEPLLRNRLEPVPAHCAAMPASPPETWQSRWVYNAWVWPQLLQSFPTLTHLNSSHMYMCDFCVQWWLRMKLHLLSWKARRSARPQIIPRTSFPTMGF